MKLDNKGFAISGVLYSLLILFVTLFIGVLTILASTKFSLDKVKNDIVDKLETLMYRDTILNGADPVLKTGMIPVTIEADGTVRKANLKTKWYDYDTKVWANAVTVTSNNRQTYMDAPARTKIEEADILTYFVWIPRYKYKLWYVDAIDGDSESLDVSKVHSIDIVFENKNTIKSEGSNNGEYLTHPAFTFGDDELNGIWVGKFETGYNGATSAEAAQISLADSTKVIIKPNTYSWTEINVSNMFYTALHMNSDIGAFGLTIDSDTHMMKNTEWGAVAYLSHSEYGTCTNGVCTEVYRNNNNGNMTGCGADAINSDEIQDCTNQYGTKDSGVYVQSTNRNISGIFDMSGGAYEYTMAYTTGASTIYGSSGFEEATFPKDKYVDIYTAINETDYSNRTLGDATGEMGPFLNYRSSWYNDYFYFVSASRPWFDRGGGYSDKSTAGLLYSYGLSGGGISGISFRIVLV